MRSGRYFILFLGLAAVWVCQGCVLIPSRLDLVHRTSAVRCPRPLRVVLQKALDQRPQNNRIGVKKNGYGMDMANIYIDDSSGGVANWLTVGLRKQFTKSGIEVLPATEGMARDFPSVTAVVKEFFVEPTVGFTIGVHSLVLVELMAEFPDGRRFARLFKGYVKDNGMVVTDSDYVEGLESAAADVFRKGAQTLCTLLSRETVR